MTHKRSRRQSSVADPVQLALAGRGNELSFSAPVWPDEGGCSAQFASWLYSPPEWACRHVAADQWEPWFVIAGEPAPIRRCEHCVPADVAESLDGIGIDEPAVIACSCCGSIGEQSHWSIMQAGAGTVLAALCGACVGGRRTAILARSS